MACQSESAVAGRKEVNGDVWRHLKSFYLLMNLGFIVFTLLFHESLRLDSDNAFFRLTYFFFLFFLVGQSLSVVHNRPQGANPWPVLGKTCMRWLGFSFASLVLWILVSQYLLCPRYNFPMAAPFQGDSLFNPYESLDSLDWAKCNFHAHVKAWKGITNGTGTADYLHQLYQSKKYAFHCVSNYHQIDTSYLGKSFYIPAYEHGYNILKTHQLVLGSGRVEWVDHLFPQTIHNRQYIIGKLGEWSNVIILNHPAIRNGYSLTDLSYLTGYNCMEVLNPARLSEKQWDAALSAGKLVFIVGNDDLHNVIKADRLGKMCTYVNVKSRKGSLVLEALKAGATFGVRLGEGQDVDSIPRLQSCRVSNDSVVITMTRPAREVVVSGQNADTIAIFTNRASVEFDMRPQYHYARAVFHYENGTSIYLNPVCYMPSTGIKTQLATVNWLETSFCRIIGVLILNFWLMRCRRFAFDSRVSIQTTL